MLARPGGLQHCPLRRLQSTDAAPHVKHATASLGGGSAGAGDADSPANGGPFSAAARAAAARSAARDWGFASLSQPRAGPRAPPCPRMPRAPRARQLCCVSRLVRQRGLRLGAAGAGGWRARRSKRRAACARLDRALTAADPPRRPPFVFLVPFLCPCSSRSGAPGSPRGQNGCADPQATPEYFAPRPSAAPAVSNAWCDCRDLPLSLAPAAVAPPQRNRAGTGMGCTHSKPAEPPEADPGRPVSRYALEVPYAPGGAMAIAGAAAYPRLELAAAGTKGSAPGWPAPPRRSAVAPPPIDAVPLGLINQVGRGAAGGGRIGASSAARRGPPPRDPRARDHARRARQLLAAAPHTRAPPRPAAPAPPRSTACSRRSRSSAAARCWRCRKPPSC